MYLLIEIETYVSRVGCIILVRCPGTLISGTLALLTDTSLSYARLKFNLLLLFSNIVQAEDLFHFHNKRVWHTGKPRIPGPTRTQNIRNGRIQVFPILMHVCVSRFYLQPHRLAKTISYRSIPEGRTQIQGVRQQDAEEGGSNSRMNINMALHILYSLLCIVTVANSRGVRLAGNVAHIKEMRNICKISVEQILKDVISGKSSSQIGS